MKASKSRRNLSPPRGRVATQRQPRASMPARLPGTGGDAWTRAWRKAIRAVAFAAVDSSRPIGIFESLILCVLQGVPIQCSETELRRELCYLEKKGVIRIDRVDGAPWMARIAGPATDADRGDVHVDARTVAETPLRARRRPAGKVGRPSSRRSTRVPR